ncbi:MAG: hypothetical protein JJE04_03250 [Acidobacteriia bacterium]|nr:hypothetical protein [Terriglobia bacterium]
MASTLTMRHCELSMQSGRIKPHELGLIGGVREAWVLLKKLLVDDHRLDNLCEIVIVLVAKVLFWPATLCEVLTQDVCGQRGVGIDLSSYVANYPSRTLPTKFSDEPAV